MAEAPASIAHAAASVRSYLAATPGRLALRFLGVCAAILLAAVVTLLSAADASRTIRTIGSDAEPSVVLALRIGAGLADLDAVATEDALAGGMSAAGTSRGWRSGKADLDALLVQASRNITYADETTALQNLLRWTGEYHASLAEVRGAADPAHPFTAIQRLQWSHRLLREFALPEAGALAAANRTPLDDAYAAYGQYHWQDGTAAAVAILPLAGVLAAVQMFLTRRTHRLVNPPLAAATALAACLLAGLLVTGAMSREALRSAKADCFDSLDALFSAKAAVAAMNADLSLWLLDPATRQAVSDGIDARARTLLNVQWRDGPTWGKLLQALAAAQADERQGRPAAARAELPELGGLLGKELDNITFGAAERDPASDAARGLLDLMQVADRVRALGTPNQMVQAVHIRETEGAAALAGLAGLQGALGSSPVLHRRLLGQASDVAKVSPADLLATMEGAFDNARALLARISTAAEADAALRARLQSAVDDLAAENRPEAADLAARLASCPASDPVAALDALETLRPAVDAASAAAAASRAGRAQAAQALAAARIRLAQLAELQAKAAQVLASAALLVSGSPSPGPATDAAELPGWLDRLARTLDAGRVEAFGVGLASWNALAARVAAGWQAVLDDAAARLTQRDDLRGRFGALQAKHRARHPGADPALDGIAAKLRAALFGGPADLAAGRRLLAAYEAGLARPPVSAR